MNNLLTEIKQLAQDGYVFSTEEKTKNIFFNILQKIDIASKYMPSMPTYNINIPKADRTYEKQDEETKRQAYIVAYCFSYYEHESLYPEYNQYEAFDKAAKKLNIKTNTLKNYRDAFDGHNQSKRRGWYQKELSPDMESVKNICNTKSRAENIAAAKKILGL